MLAKDVKGDSKLLKNATSDELIDHIDKVLVLMKKNQCGFNKE